MNQINYIKLEKIYKDKSLIRYEFSCSPDFDKFFSCEDFYIKYDVDISEVPDSILAIPFVSSVLPLIMIANANLYLDEIDKDFLDCIPKLAAGYETMFPETRFLGRIIANKILPSKELKKRDKVAMFYSGGLDSVNTLIRHFDEKPDLIAIWGSDIRHDNGVGWSILFNTLSNEADILKLPLMQIKTSFRAFDNESNLEKVYSKQLKDGWWHGVKHGIALIGHVAPIAYLRNYKTVYIASSNCLSDKNVRCASNPATDNTIRFCGTRVCHDGFEYNRQDKTNYIIEYSKVHNLKPKLHVCWKTQTGDNCCSCEKCYRTIFNIMVEGVQPEDFGFGNMDAFYNTFNHNSLLLELLGKYNLQAEFDHIADRFRQNKTVLKKNKNYKYMKWLKKLNLNDLKTFNPSYWFIFKRRIRGLLRRVLNKIHKATKLFFAYFAYKKHLKNKIAIVGTPLHNNIGDLAIAIAEFDIVKDCGYSPYEITYSEVKSYLRIFKIILKNKIIILHGGGNMGDTWYNEELLRRLVLSRIKAKKIVIMPQTLFYSNTPDGLKKEKDSVPIYNKSSVYLLMRDKASYDKACNLYPNANKYLTSDVVLSLKHDFNKHNRNGKALLIFRSDIEKSLDSKIVKSIKQYLESNNIPYDETDMYSFVRPNGSNNRMIVSNKLEDISKYSYVITDRLHGMIFSAITSTSCVAFNNDTKKVEGTYDLIKLLGYVKLCTNYDDFVSSFNILKDDKANSFNDQKIKYYCVPVIKSVLCQKN